MPRRPRLFLEGLPLHVVQRGNDRQSIFRRDIDYTLFRMWLMEAAREHALAIHAYVFMSNHLHVLATPAHALSVARVMQDLGRRYVRCFNDTYDRTGGLWESRYRAALVDTDRYLLTCMRYIELNPVRAGMTRHPADYPYSSFRANALGISDPLVTPHETYLAIANSQARRCQAYQRLFDTAFADDDLRAIRAALNNNWALGDASFEERVEAVLGRRAIARPIGRPSASK